MLVLGEGVLDALSIRMPPQVAQIAQLDSLVVYLLSILEGPHHLVDTSQHRHKRQDSRYLNKSLKLTSQLQHGRNYTASEQEACSKCSESQFPNTNPPSKRGKDEKADSGTEGREAGKDTTC